MTYERTGYPAVIEWQTDCFVVHFPDLDGAITGGDTRAEAREMARDCLESWLSAAIIERWNIPPPSPASGRPMIIPGAMIAAKLALHRAMLESKISNVALAKIVGCDEAEVRHMRNPRRATKITRIEEALGHLGIQLVVGTRKQAA